MAAMAWCGLVWLGSVCQARVVTERWTRSPEDVMRKTLTGDGGGCGPSIALTRVRPHHSDPCPVPSSYPVPSTQPAPRPSLPASPVQPAPPSPTSAVNWSFATPPSPHPSIASSSPSWQGSRLPKIQTKPNCFQDAATSHVLVCPVQPGPDRQAHRAPRSSSRRGNYRKKDVHPLVHDSNTLRSFSPSLVSSSLLLYPSATKPYMFSLPLRLSSAAFAPGRPLYYRYMSCPIQRT